MTPTKLYVFDLDGTLADCTHRLHYIKSDPPKWKEFFDACLDDPVIEHMFRLAVDLSRHGHVVILTGRTSSYREQTLKWLNMNGIPCEWLLMRKEKDYRHDFIVKGELLEEHVLHLNANGPDYNVEFVVDDRPEVVEQFRLKGYNVLQCRLHEGAAGVSRRMEAQEHVA